MTTRSNAAQSTAASSHTAGCASTPSARSGSSSSCSSGSSSGSAAHVASAIRVTVASLFGREPDDRRVTPDGLALTSQAQLLHDPLRRRVVEVRDADEALEAPLRAELQSRGATLAGQALTPHVARDHPADLRVVRACRPVVVVHQPYPADESSRLTLLDCPQPNSALFPMRLEQLDLLARTVQVVIAQVTHRFGVGVDVRKAGNIGIAPGA